MENDNDNDNVFFLKKSYHKHYPSSNEYRHEIPFWATPSECTKRLVENIRSEVLREETHFRSRLESCFRLAQLLISFLPITDHLVYAETL